MSARPTAAWGWKRVYTKDTGWTDPQLYGITKDAVLVEDKTWPVEGYPGWSMTLQRSNQDPKLWILVVAYDDPGKAAFDYDSLMIFVTKSDAQPKMPVSFTWGTTRWWLLGVGVGVLTVAVLIMMRRRKGKVSRRALSERVAVETADVAMLPDVPPSAPLR